MTSCGEKEAENVATRKTITRYAISVLVVIWVTLFANYSQIFGGAIWLDDKTVQSILFAVLLVIIPVLIFGIVFTIASNRSKVYLCAVPIVLSIIGTALLQVSFQQLVNNIEWKYIRLTLKDLTLTDLTPYSRKVVNEKTNLCWYMWRGFPVSRYETRLGPGLLWVKEIPEVH